MYNGTIQLSNATDLSILQEQIDLIAGINSQLKEFSSLKSNVGAVFEIIKSGKDGIRETVAAGKELSSVAQTGANAALTLSQNMGQVTTSTDSARQSSKVFSSIMNASAIQITAVIVAITAVVAAISMFVKWLNRTNEAGEAAKTSAENLVSAQEELSQSAIDSSAAYTQTTASLQAAGESASAMTARLEALQGSVQRTDAENQEMAQIISDLTGRYTGLNNMIDENTGALTGNAEQWTEVINAQLGYEQAQAAMSRSTELTQQATEAQLNLATAQQMVSDNEEKISKNAEQRNKLEAEAAQVYSQLTDGSQRTAEEIATLQQRYIDLGNQAESLTQENNGLKDANKTLEKGMGELSDTAERLTQEQQAQAELAQQQTQAALESYSARIDAVNTYRDISSQMSDEEIANINALLEAGGTLTASEMEKYQQIRDARAEDLLEEQAYIQNIRDGLVEIDAANVESIEKRKALGEELTAAEQATLDRWKEMQEEWAAGIQENTDTIINGMQELPTEMGYSLDDMVNVMNENAAKYDAWRAKMVAVSQSLEPEVMSYLEQLGPGTSAILDEIIEDTSGTKAAELNAAFASAGESAINGMETKYPEVMAAGAEMTDVYGEGIASSTAANDASQAIAEGVVNNLAGGKFGAIAEEIANSLSDSIPAITEQVNNLSTSIADALSPLLTVGQSTIQNMLILMSLAFVIEGATVSENATTLANTLSDAFSSLALNGFLHMSNMLALMSFVLFENGPALVAQAAILAGQVSDALGGMVPGGKNNVENMFSGMKSSIITQTPTLPPVASDAASDVTAELESMIIGGTDASGKMMSGILNGMENNKKTLFQKAAEIANSITSTIRKALKINSPSRVMIDIFQNVMQGAINGMISMEGKTFRTASNIALGVADKLTLSPEQAEFANSKMLALSSTSLGAMPTSRTVQVWGSPSNSHDSSHLLQKAVDILDEYLPEMANMRVVLDTGATVGGMAPAIDAALGRRAKMKARG